MARTLLTPAELTSALAALPEWSVGDGALVCQLSFPDFSAAFAFVTRVALLAERADHHPDLTLSYNRLTLRLTTHDVGGLTGRDLELAAAIDQLR